MSRRISVRLDQQVRARLGRIVRRMGISRSVFTRQALVDHLEDFEDLRDLYAARRVSARVAAGRERLIPLEEVLSGK